MPYAMFKIVSALLSSMSIFATCPIFYVWRITPPTRLRHASATVLNGNRGAGMPVSAVGNVRRALSIYARFRLRLMEPRSVWIFSCRSVMAYSNCSGRGGQPGT